MKKYLVPLIMLLTTMCQPLSAGNSAPAPAAQSAEAKPNTPPVAEEKTPEPTPPPPSQTAEVARKAPIEALEVEMPAVKLSVAIVVDGELSPMTPSDINLILSTAQKTMAEKLAYNNISFEIKKTMTVEEFIDSSLKNAESCRKNLEDKRYSLDKEPDFTPFRNDILTFLKRWELDELKEFFSKEKAAAYKKHEDLIDDIITVYKENVNKIKSINLPNGNSLLSPQKAPYRSYVNWICAMQGQTAYDIVLTNEFVLYDLITEPYPHSIFQKCKVGGASLKSPSRKIMPQRALFASTFGIENKLPFFDEDPAGNISHEEKQKITGMFILAHELGHAIFKLPDFYDHPDTCLMTTKAETDYITGYNLLKNNPGTCPKCQPWVEARRHYFRALELYSQKKYEEAIDFFKKVIKETPKHIDGSYRSMLADVVINIAKCYHDMGNAKEAKRWLKSARNADQYNETPAALWQTWFGEKMP